MMTENKDERREQVWKDEEVYLNTCVKLIGLNLEKLKKDLDDISIENIDLYNQYRSNNPELHNDLVLGLDWQQQLEVILKKNSLALNKPYFGRIDYSEIEEGEAFSLYIGKNAIRKNSKDIMIIDWRAPVSSVYYDSELGNSSYVSTLGDEIEVNLVLKRTFEIEDARLIDFFDAGFIANDEFLTKYLSKNKEVVLGEIIATIQKEQNNIIRDIPWHNIIVQGVAGSGKTTVAMHRISYILYNYGDKLKSKEFYIIGSNKMLLNYITSVLPNLDVYNINQMTLEAFYLSLLDEDFDLKKEKVTLVNSFSRRSKASISPLETKVKQYKGSLAFIYALEKYLKDLEEAILNPHSVKYKGCIVFSKEDVHLFLQDIKEKPLQEKIELLNKRLAKKIRYVNELAGTEKEVVREDLKKYTNYFGKKNMKIKLQDIYELFLKQLLTNQELYTEAYIKLPDSDVILAILERIQEGTLDIYDIGMLTYIKKKLIQTVDFTMVRHIVIDEAQDFGIILFYILKQLFNNCTYTIMGDVSQNIYYDSGMNDWVELREIVFNPKKDRFYTLAKSYRNTVEISNYASTVLKNCTFETYEIEPILRHGKAVVVESLNDEYAMFKKTKEVIQEIKASGYGTIAVICATIEDTLRVQAELNKTYELELFNEENEDMTFKNGIMVLPIHMTKGLEFDVVILWNPNTENYDHTNRDAKLLYVAITRALHELYLFYQGELSRLLLPN